MYRQELVEAIKLAKEISEQRDKLYDLLLVSMENSKRFKAQRDEAYSQLDYIDEALKNLNAIEEN